MIGWSAASGRAKSVRLTAKALANGTGVRKGRPYESGVGAPLDGARERGDIPRMEPQRVPVRQTDNLHKGRLSIAGAQYFITLVARDRKPWLAGPKACRTTLKVLRDWHAENQGRILAATVMPDHVHVLFELGDRSTIGQTIGRWKAETRKGMEYAEDFQRDFWEHRLRETSDIEDYALYIFLNPYRAALLAAARSWPGWCTPDAQLFRFTLALDKHGAPPPEWTEWPDERFAGLAHGE